VQTQTKVDKFSSHVYFACDANSEMKSTFKTTAAVLRSIIEVKDSAWADMLGKSVHTIRHLEAGTLKLSDAMAMKMVYQSGISIGWLMDGNPAAPPIAQDGREYTKKIYDEVQAKEKHFATVSDYALGRGAIEFFRQILAIMLSANRQRKFHLAFYRTANAIVDLSDEFGEAKELDNTEKALAYVESVLTFKPKSKRPSREKKRRRE
jgi:hypothetical protein